MDIQTPNREKVLRYLAQLDHDVLNLPILVVAKSRGDGNLARYYYGYDRMELNPDFLRMLKRPKWRRMFKGSMYHEVGHGTDDLEFNLEKRRHIAQAFGIDLYRSNELGYCWNDEGYYWVPGVSDAVPYEKRVLEWYADAFVDVAYKPGFWVHEQFPPITDAVRTAVREALDWRSQ